MQNVYACLCCLCGIVQESFAWNGEYEIMLQTDLSISSVHLDGKWAMDIAMWNSRLDNYFHVNSYSNFNLVFQTGLLFKNG